MPVWWVCPLCNSQDTTYSRAQDLSDHISELHNDIFTEPQIQIIVRQSRLRSPRPQDICPLCCLSMKEKDSDDKEHVLRQGFPKSSLRDEEPSESHKRIKTETGSTQQNQQSHVNFEPPTEDSEIQSSQSQSLLYIEAIASHVAAHLQGIMLFTLRMMSLRAAPDTSTDDKTLSGGTDYGLSHVGSNQQFSEQGPAAIDDLSIQEDSDMDVEQPFEVDSIPDCEHEIDWQDVVPDIGPLSGTDTFLQGVISSGAFRTKE